MSPNSTCKSCKQPLPADGAFCARCGSQARDPEKTLLAVRRISEGTRFDRNQCGSCNALLRPEDIYCRFCGAQDRDPAESNLPAGPDPMQERLRSATAGEFAIIKRLGRGGMGSVYLARETALRRYVAIKVLAAEFLSDETVLKRFRTEARIVATLRHRSIVGIHTVRHEEGLHYFVMDYVEGASLSDVIRSHGPLPATVVKAVLYEVGSALTYAHRQGDGIIHRDIKPGNIMLDSEGAVVVMDYGISKPVGSKADLTMHGSLIGTPEYMSPEQCRGNVLTAASDQYALGLLGYAMLCGAPPFSGPPWTVITSQLQGTPPPIRETRPDCPRDLAACVHRMLEKAPGERWPSIPEAIASFGGRHHDIGDPVREETARLARESEGATAVEVPVSRIAVVAPEGDVEPGDEFLLRAEAFDDLGRVLSDRLVQWTTSDPNILRVSPDQGVVTALAPGTAVITAVVDHVGTSLECTVGEPSPDSIMLEPGTLLLYPEGRAQLTAVVKDRHSNLLSGEARWSSGDGGVVTVSQDGEVLAHGAGLSVVIAEIGGLRAQAQVTVEIAPLPEIDTSDLPAPVFAGDVFQLRLGVVGGPGYGGADTSWTSSDKSVASVKSGLVRVEGPGVAEIVARSEGVEAAAQIVVVDRAVAEVILELPRDRLELGEELVLHAAARDQRGDFLERDIMWGSTDTSVATVDPAGVVRAVSPGQTEVSAIADGVPGVATLTVVPCAVHAIKLSTPSRSLLEKATLSLEVAATDERGRAVEGQAVQWEVSDENVGTISRRGFVTGVAPGALTVTATCGGESASIGLRVTARRVAAVRISSPPFEVRAGDDFELRAMAVDTDDQELSRRFEWRSSDTSVATVDASGSVTAVNSGSVELTAAVGGIEGTAAVTVDEALVGAGARGAPRWLVALGGLALPILAVVGWQEFSSPDELLQPAPLEMPGPIPAVVASVEVQAPSDAVQTGETVRLTVTARTAGGESVPPSEVDWRVDPPDRASVTQDGVLVAGLAGRVRVSAIVNGIDGAVDLIIAPRPEEQIETETDTDASPRPADPPTAEVVEQPDVETTPTVASLDIKGPSGPVSVGDRSALVVTARDESGRPLDAGSIGWSVSDASVASVDAGGVLLARSGGTVRVTATASGVQGSVDVEVSQPEEPTAPRAAERPPIASVALTLSQFNMNEGERQPYRVDIRDGTGAPLPQVDREITVRSSSSTLVAANGLVTASAPGTAYLVVSAEGVADSLQISVRAAVASVSILGAIAQLAVGASVVLRAEIRGSLQQLLPTRTVDWESSDSSVVTIDWTGTLQGVSPGTADVIATSEGVQSRVTVAVGGGAKALRDED